MNKSINSGKGKLKLTGLNLGFLPSLGSREEVFGSPLAVFSGFVPAIGRTYPILLQYVFARKQSSLELLPYLSWASPRCYYLLVGRSQLNLPVMAEATGTICPK